MSQDRRAPAPAQEALLISLDQLSQTLEVMGKVISRLRYQIEDSQQLSQAPPHDDHASHMH